MVSLDDCKIQVWAGLLSRVQRPPAAGMGQDGADSTGVSWWARFDGLGASRGGMGQDGADSGLSRFPWMAAVREARRTAGMEFCCLVPGQRPKRSRHCRGLGCFVQGWPGSGLGRGCLPMVVGSCSGGSVFFWFLVPSGQDQHLRQAHDREDRRDAGAHDNPGFVS